MLHGYSIVSFRKKVPQEFFRLVQTLDQNVDLCQLFLSGSVVRKKPDSLLQDLVGFLNTPPPQRGLSAGQESKRFPRRNLPRPQESVLRLGGFLERAIADSHVVIDLGIFLTLGGTQIGFQGLARLALGQEDIAPEDESGVVFLFLGKDAVQVLEGFLTLVLILAQSSDLESDLQVGRVKFGGSFQGFQGLAPTLVVQVLASQEDLVTEFPFRRHDFKGSLSDDLNDNLPASRPVVEIHQDNLLPDSQKQLLLREGNGQRGTQKGGSYVGVAVPPSPPALVGVREVLRADTLPGLGQVLDQPCFILKCR